MFFKKNIFLFFYFLMLILISCYEGTNTYSRGEARGGGGGRKNKLVSLVASSRAITNYHLKIFYYLSNLLYTPPSHLRIPSKVYISYFFSFCTCIFISVFFSYLRW